MKEDKKCCICTGTIDKQYHDGVMYWARGHNAEPVKTGQCCSDCHNKFVIPARINQHMKYA